MKMYPFIVYEEECIVKSYSVYDRILGSLTVAGMGDGMGGATEAMSTDEIKKKFGGLVTKFEDPFDNKIAYGNFVAEVTDDASQMYEMAKMMVKEKGNLTVQGAADALVIWSESYPKYFPRNAGPTTSHVIKELKEGADPEEVGKVGLLYGRGTSNGAAMRVAAAGLVHPGDLEGAVQTAVIMTKPSHGTQHAYSGACAIACAIAEAMTEQANVFTIIKAALYGAKRGEEIGLKEARIATGVRLYDKLLEGITIGLDATDMEDCIAKLEARIGNGGEIQPSVACAMGLFVFACGDPHQTILGGANIGGDTDTIACIAGMVAGAYSGYEALRKDWVELFEQANPALDFKAVSKDLAAIAESRL